MSHLVFTRSMSLVVAKEYSSKRMNMNEMETSVSYSYHFPTLQSNGISRCFRSVKSKKFPGLQGALLYFRSCELDDFNTFPVR